MDQAPGSTPTPLTPAPTPPPIWQRPVSRRTVLATAAGGAGAAALAALWRGGSLAQVLNRVQGLTHTYARAGTYSVSLTVTDNAGESTVAVRSVTVAAAGRITKVSIKPVRGGATVAVSVSSAGTLTAGKRVFHLKRAGTVKLVIALTRAQLRAVQVKHLLKVRVPLRFAPTLGPLASTSAVIAFRPAATSGHLAAIKAR